MNASCWRNPTVPGVRRVGDSIPGKHFSEQIAASYLAGILDTSCHGINAATVPHRTRRHAATAIAVGIGAGYAAIPLAVVTGILHHTQ